MHQRGGAPHAGTDVDEQIGRTHAGVVDQAQEGVDGAWKVRHAANRKVAAVLGGSAETEDEIDPGVARDRWNARELRAKQRRLALPPFNPRSKALGALTSADIHDRTEDTAEIAPCRTAITGSVLLRAPSSGPGSEGRRIMAEILIHPAVDGGLKPAAKDF